MVLGAGVGFKAFNKTGEIITSELFAPSGFMKVDADYSIRAFEDWSVEDWPSTYQSPAYANIFATGIAFATPHQISMPMKSPNGTLITPAPPRTGMPSGVIGIIVALNIIEKLKQSGQISDIKLQWDKWVLPALYRPGTE